MFFTLQNVIRQEYFWFYGYSLETGRHSTLRLFSFTAEQQDYNCKQYEQVYFLCLKHLRRFAFIIQWRSSLYHHLEVSGFCFCHMVEPKSSYWWSPSTYMIFVFTQDRTDTWTATVSRSTRTLLWLILFSKRNAVQRSAVLIKTHLLPVIPTYECVFLCNVTLGWKLRNYRISGCGSNEPLNYTNGRYTVGHHRAVLVSVHRIMKITSATFDTLVAALQLPWVHVSSLLSEHTVWSGVAQRYSVRCFQARTEIKIAP
jgi:hypothetical protein